MSIVIPTGWELTNLESVADFQDSQREPVNSSEREARIKDKPITELFPYYGATGQVGWIDSFRSEGESVLLGEDGAPFLDPNKDKAYLVTGCYWVNNHAHILRGFNECLSTRFLCYQLNTVDYKGFVTGTTRLKLTSSAMKQIPFLLAPYNEQTRVIEKLEELFSDLDAGVAELKAAQKKLVQYRQSLLKSAVGGVLTAEWRTKNKPKETGTKLLARILEERRVRWEEKQLAKFKEQCKTPPKWWQDKYPEPVQPDTTNLPELPEGWVWASVDQICPDDIANGKSVPTATSGPKVLRLTAVKVGRIDLGEFKYGVWSDRDAEPFFVKNGDVLIVRGNGSLSLVGRAGLVSGVTSDIAYPDTMIRVRILDGIVLPEWLGLVWDSALIRDHLQTRARTSAGIYKIAQPDIVSAIIPVPPLLEQKAIIVAIDEANLEIQRIEGLLNLGLKQSAAQRKNILKSAFSGLLVQQDPNDEPASVLLERIRAERQACESSTRKRGSRKKLEKA